MRVWVNERDNNRLQKEVTGMRQVKSKAKDEALEAQEGDMKHESSRGAMIQNASRIGKRYGRWVYDWQ